MSEIIIKFLDIATIKFIGTEELIELVKKYYPGLEIENSNADYTIQLNNKILPKNIDIPSTARPGKCFAGPIYYSWSDDKYNLAYSPPEERGGSHLVLKKGNNFQVSFHKGEPPNQIVGISREILVKETLERGYMPIHASAVFQNGKGYVFFGDKNKGKSTSFFSSILYDNSQPMSGDIAFVRKEDDNWQVLGWPWTATIDKSYFDITGKVPTYNTANKGKVKFYPADFCQEFEREWIWKSPLEEIINVNLDPTSKGKKENINREELKERLIKYGTEKWWTWNDVFGIGEKKPIYNYDDISKDVNGSILSGDIIQFFKEKNRIVDFER